MMLVVNDSVVLNSQTAFGSVVLTKGDERGASRWQLLENAKHDSSVEIHFEPHFERMGTSLHGAVLITEPL